MVDTLWVLGRKGVVNCTGKAPAPVANVNENQNGLL